MLRSPEKQERVAQHDSKGRRHPERSEGSVGSNNRCFAPRKSRNAVAQHDRLFQGSFKKADMAIGIRKQEKNTRAQQLRRKREKPAPRSLNWNSRAAAAHPAAPQPAWEIRPRNGAARVQRMYNIPLAGPAAGAQLPVLTLSFSPRGLATILSGLACAGLLFLLAAPMFRAEAPMVLGLQHLTADSILTASDLTGANLFLISPAFVEGEILRKIPAVRSATVA